MYILSIRSLEQPVRTTRKTYINGNLELKLEFMPSPWTSPQVDKITLVYTFAVQDLGRMI